MPPAKRSDLHRDIATHYAALAEASRFDERLLGNYDLERLEVERENSVSRSTSLWRWIPALALERRRRLVRSLWCGATNTARGASAWPRRSTKRRTRPGGLARGRFSRLRHARQPSRAISRSRTVWGTEALALFRELGDRRGEGWTLQLYSGRQRDALCRVRRRQRRVELAAHLTASCGR